MDLIKYRDYYDKDYSWFWTHPFDGVEKTVSDTFATEEEALEWGKMIKEKIAAEKKVWYEIHL